MWKHRDTVHDRSHTPHRLQTTLTPAQAAVFMAQMLGVSVQELSDLAQSVPDAGGVTFVPAVAGLGAPDWDDRATGLINGMTHGTSHAHLGRATFEAIACQIADGVDAVERDTGSPLAHMRADGGASASLFLMQLQADIPGRPVL